MTHISTKQLVDDQDYDAKKNTVHMYTKHTHTQGWGWCMPQAPKSVSGLTFVDKVKDLKMEIFSMKRKGP